MSERKYFVVKNPNLSDYGRRGKFVAVHDGAIEVEFDGSDTKRALFSRNDVARYYTAYQIFGTYLVALLASVMEDRMFYATDDGRVYFTKTPQGTVEVERGKWNENAITFKFPFGEETIFVNPDLDNDSLIQSNLATANRIDRGFNVMDLEDDEDYAYEYAVELIKRHNFDYVLSDARNTYAAGNASEKRMRAAMRSVESTRPEIRDVYNEERAKSFVGGGGNE